MRVSSTIRSGNLWSSGSMHHWLLASSCFSCLLLLVRVIVTGSLNYIFLPWNLFLAFIPYWITGWITKDSTRMRNKLKLLPALALWLLFVPNSFYIITDLFHLTHIRTAPTWFDLLLVFSFAWNGILCGIISLWRVESIVTLVSGKKLSILMIFGVMWLNAFGIYIGRYLRFNSWDIVNDPFSLLAEIAAMICRPLDNFYGWGMTFCYAAFITFLYFTIKKSGESFTVIK